MYQKTMFPIQKELRKYASKNKAVGSMIFFKTGPGQYAEGDQFLGATVPEIRLVAKKYANLSLPEIKQLLLSSYNEERSLALMILVEQYARKTRDPKIIVDFFLENKARVNNWNLVDGSAYKILGDYCLQTNNKMPLKKLLKSKQHWDRRIAIVSTYAFIRKSEIEIVFHFAKKLLTDKEDLMHKATGWMLREAGKRNPAALRKFIRNSGKKMPRTMLRYAIEKFPLVERKKILLETRA